jgi:hypothetical protein
MNNMSDFIKNMQQVPEKGLQSEQQLKEIREHREQMVKSGNSYTNHARAYQEVINGPQPVKKEEKGVQMESTLLEEDTTKIIGALQVVKELLDCNLTENTADIASKVKKIISKI